MPLLLLITHIAIPISDGYASNGQATGVLSWIKPVVNAPCIPCSVRRRSIHIQVTLSFVDALKLLCEKQLQHAFYSANRVANEGESMG